MTLGTNEFLQLTLLLCTIGASWGVVRSNVQRLLSDLSEQRRELEALGRRADELEQQSKVLEHQMSVLGSILSPSSLKEANREMAELKARVDINTRDVIALQKMHNGNHPSVAHT